MDNDLNSSRGMIGFLNSVIRCKGQFCFYFQRFRFTNLATKREMEMNEEIVFRIYYFAGLATISSF